VEACACPWNRDAEGSVRTEEARTPPSQSDYVSTRDGGIIHESVSTAFWQVIGDVMHDHLEHDKTPQLFSIAPAPAPAQKPHDHHTRFMVGLDVGSTTVKATIVDAETDKVLWQDYQRHETKQPEKTLEFLRRMEKEVGINSRNTRIFMTGSGGGAIVDQIGAKFVQEVTAVSLAVEKMHPEVYSVIELGGQDAKIIVFKDDADTGRKKKIPSMNDSARAALAQSSTRSTPN
jgi:activator of 2-hydroxyglutaryl-CoA dehydratase